MKTTAIKTGVKRLIDAIVHSLGATSIGRFLYARITHTVMERTQTVRHGNVTLVFAIPNALTKFRADTFSTKEPETLEWIDGMTTGSVVWDIGANVGLYTCYAAKARDCRVFAFEPSVFNLELLARNIFSNGLTHRATIVPLPLSDELSLNTLNLTTTEWGGAMSTFGHDYGHDGRTLQRVFAYPTVGLSMVDAMQLMRIPQPDHIKMDVDGIEHLILKGGIPVLRAAKSVLIEINDEFDVQAGDAGRYLRDAGLSLKAKRHADCFDSATSPAKRTFNQIWCK